MISVEGLWRHAEGPGGGGAETLPERDCHNLISAYLQLIAGREGGVFLGKQP